MNLERRTEALESLRRQAAIAVIAIASLGVAAYSSSPVAASSAATRYVVDPYWPKALPNQWQLGAVAGVAVDDRDHVWIIQRPATPAENERAASFKPPRAACCVPAPSVIEFAIDSKGNLYTAEVDTGKRLQRFTAAP